MSFTMTFDAGVKVKRGGHAMNLFRHIARDIDQAAGYHFPQRNPNIVDARTHLNASAVNDGAGAFRKPVSTEGRPPSAEFNDYLQQRLGTVRKPLRRDAVLMRPIILQLDPTWFDRQNPDWRENRINADARRHMNAALEWACSEFSQQNIVGFSLHLDEYSPQLQVLMTPITPDGRLSQRDFFKGPHDFKRQHEELRAAVAATGYDVDYRVTERSKEHLSSSEFQARGDRLRSQAKKLDEDLAITEMLKVRLRSRSSAADAREAAAAAREKEAAAAKASSKAAAQHAIEVESRAQRELAAAIRVQEEVREELERRKRVNSRLEAVPPYIERWLDRTKENGVPLRKRFEADRVKMRAGLLAIAENEPRPTPTNRPELDL